MYAEPRKPSGPEPEPLVLAITHDAGDADQRDEETLPLEVGLVRALAIGGFIGFVAVFVIVAGGLTLLGTDVVSAVLSGIFVGAFGGIGFGGMAGASLHQPRRVSATRRR